MSLAQDYLSHQTEFDRIIRRVLTSGVYILGPEVALFEQRFSAWLGVPRMVGCANGTDAITLALLGLGLAPGAKVATVSHTAVATVAGIQRAGCVPVLLDVGDDYLIDVDELQVVLQTSDIAAVVIVHLYGRPAQIQDIVDLCARHGVAVVEDCSQAHGASVGGRKVGTFGDVATFSFYPTKNLAAFGDGGAVACASNAMADRVARLRQYGWDDHRDSLEPGFNSRLDELQAALLTFKLGLLDDANARRRAVAALYNNHLQELEIVTPSQIGDDGAVHHLYVVRTPRRDALFEFLKTKSVPVGIHYKTPVHRQSAYLNSVLLGPRRCENTETLCKEIISLPIGPYMTDSDVIDVVDHIREFCEYT